MENEVLKVEAVIEIEVKMSIKIEDLDNCLGDAEQMPWFIFKGGSWSGVLKRGGSLQVLEDDESGEPLIPHNITLEDVKKGLILWDQAAKNKPGSGIADTWARFLKDGDYDGETSCILEQFVILGEYKYA